jgi:hypothetical protein
MNITAYRTNWMLRSAVGTALVFAGAGLCSADGFFDDFEDGSVTNDIPLSDDGIPVKWTPRLNRPGDYDVLDGDYVLTPVPASGEFLTSNMLEVDFGNTSIRSRVRTSEMEHSVGISARNQAADESQLYFGGILANANNDPTLFLGRSDSGGGRTFFAAGVEILPSFDLSCTF